MLDVHTEGSLRVVTLDRPAVRNAITPAGLTALGETFEAAEEPVVYLTGRGGAFCAGADLTVVEKLDPDGARRLAARGQQVARTIATYDGVVLAGIDGPARGGGVDLALACDLRVATPEATFAESGVHHGLFGAWGGTARLPDVVGRGEAMDLAVSGRVVDAQEAEYLGLVSRVVDDPKAVATELQGFDDEALRTIKRRIRDDAPLAAQEAAEVDAFASLIASRNRGQSED